MLGVPDYLPPVCGENVDYVCSQVPIGEYPGMTPELERFLVGQVLTSVAQSPSKGTPSWVAWAALRPRVGNFMERMLGDHYQEETWDPIMAHLMQTVAESFGVSFDPPPGTHANALTDSAKLGPDLFPEMAQRFREITDRKAGGQSN